QRGKPSVIGRSQLIGGDIFARCEDAVAHLFRRINTRIDRRNDADKDLAIFLQMPANDLENPWPVLFSYQLNAKRSGIQIEQSRQQIGVIDIRPVGRITIAPGQVCTAMRFRSAPEKPASARLFKSMKLFSSRGRSFTASRASVKSISTFTTRFSKQRRS